MDFLGQEAEAAVRQAEALGRRHRVTETRPPVRRPVSGSLRVIRQSEDAEGTICLTVCRIPDRAEPDGQAGGSGQADDSGEEEIRGAVR